MGTLKPQDLLVLLKLVATAQKMRLRQTDVAQALGISQAEVHKAFQRTMTSGFLISNSLHHSPEVRCGALTEFLIHGVKYIFPARIGEVTRGLPTAWGVPALAQGFAVNDGDTPVWPWSEGTIRGGSVVPLYKTAPQAAAHDSNLHELLALVDCIRIGRARDREMAAKRLSERLAG